MTFVATFTNMFPPLNYPVGKRPDRKPPSVDEVRLRWGQAKARNNDYRFILEEAESTVMRLLGIKNYPLGPYYENFNRGLLVPMFGEYIRGGVKLPAWTDVALIATVGAILKLRAEMQDSNLQNLLAQSASHTGQDVGLVASDCSLKGYITYFAGQCGFAEYPFKALHARAKDKQFDHFRSQSPIDLSCLTEIFF